MFFDFFLTRWLVSDFLKENSRVVQYTSITIATRTMSTNAVVSGHYGPLDGTQPPPPPGLVPTSGGPDHTGGAPPMKHDINEILQQIMNITDQSLDEAQAR